LAAALEDIHWQVQTNALHALPDTAVQTKHHLLKNAQTALTPLRARLAALYAPLDMHAKPQISYQSSALLGFTLPLDLQSALSAKLDICVPQHHSRLWDAPMASTAPQALQSALHAQLVSLASAQMIWQCLVQQALTASGFRLTALCALRALSASIQRMHLAHAVKALTQSVEWLLAQRALPVQCVLQEPRSSS
jgi:hypothetical protein